MHFIACQTFAGGFDAGATQAGMTLVHKVEEDAGFGLPMCEANRDFLGHDWTSQACAPSGWEVPSCKADVVIGNPPCSLADSRS